MTNYDEDLGFSFRLAKSDEVKISHHGRHATVLRAKKAVKFVQDMQDISFAEQQQIMARLTGNYKRGNERTAKKHSRNSG